MAHVPAAVVRRAARAVFEGAPVTFALLARLTGRTAGHFRQVAREEGWRAPSDTDAQGLERRLLALSDRLVQDLEAASAEASATGCYDKQKIDALSATLRMVEKLGEMARVPERAADNQKKSDEELAEALALIDARIVELACELAASMGGGEADAGPGAEGAG